MSTILTEDQKDLAAGYVLNDLAPDELRCFEAQLHTNKALQAEVKALSTALAFTPQALPIMTPPNALRERILKVSSTPSTALLKHYRVAWSKIVAGLMMLVALASGAYSFRLKHALYVSQHNNLESAEVMKVSATLLQRPSTRLISLQGQGVAAAGTVLFTPGKWQTVVVSLSNLPPLPPERVYRMWLTLKDGTTLHCGSFNPDVKGSVFMKLSPPQAPPKDNKAVGIFVTTAAASEPLTPDGIRVMSGSI